ncbi:hypothetical protein NQ318_015240, partial [Aromia moschata]
MRPILKIFVPAAVILFVSAESESDGPQVRIGDGVVRGKYVVTKGGRQFSAFLGIPFAKPPLGELRFKPPVPNDPWVGEFNATKVHPVCPQRDVYRRTSLIEGEEDCLYLNVYTPQLPQRESHLLPVMVFLHGGGWLCGSGNSLWYGPDILLDRDIVLVVTNYRLGALGFLSTGDEVVPGNNGLKDQNLALKWVKNNVDKFGGDPDSVTIFGESAGGVSAQFHMTSTMSKGLFHRVIAQSGTAFCSWSIAAKDEVVKNSKKLAKIFECPTNSSVEMVECLRSVDPFDLVNQDTQFMEWDYDPMIPFKPVIEPKVEGAFLTEHPAEAFRSGRAADVPLIVGLNTEDGALKVAALSQRLHLVKEFSDNFEKLAPLSLFYDSWTDDMDSITKRIKEFYFGSEEIHKSDISNLIHLYTDGWFLSCADEAVRYQLKYSKQPVYYYLFAHRGVASLTEIFGGEDSDLGVCHADELQYLFPIGDGLFPDRKPSDDDKQVSTLLTTLWTNFAKTGNPTSEVNEVIKEKWQPVASSESMEYYYIEKSTGMRSGLFLDRAKLWRSLSLEQKTDKVE